MTFNLARRHVALMVASCMVHPAAAAAPTVELTKMRACGCCTAWARHLERAGFVVTIAEVDDLVPVRAEAGVPEDLAGCHTAKVDGFVVEGHVPAAVVWRLLGERPDVRGVAVRGMPIGSPGMAIEGEPAEPFDVVAFAGDGSRYVFEEVRP